jgi:sec-independent protein translocase protein TatA
MFGLSPAEMVIVGVVAVLLFGGKLPEVAKSIGKSMMEFKRGLQGIDQEVRAATRYTPPPAPARPQRFNEIDDRDEPTAPKFEPPPEETAPPTAA